VSEGTPAERSDAGASGGAPGWAPAITQEPRPELNRQSPPTMAPVVIAQYQPSAVVRMLMNQMMPTPNETAPLNAARRMKEVP
jgi:hypothetical protein